MSYEAWGEPPEEPCQCCGRWSSSCECPECPVCHVVGDPACYGVGGHGLEWSREQIDGLDRLEPQPDDII